MKSFLEKVKTVIVAIHQPAYWPWLGLVEKIALCDRFIVLDDVQFNSRAYQHRALYSSPQGVRYLTIPIQRDGKQTLKKNINELIIADPSFSQKHFQTLQQRYSRCSGWKLVNTAIESIYQRQPTIALDLILPTLQLTLEVFDVRTEVLFSSKIPHSGGKGELMLNLTEAVGGQIYFSGAGARSYMEEIDLTNRKIGIQWQDFKHPVYSQSLPGEFQSGCMALDWFLEHPDSCREKFHMRIDRIKKEQKWRH